jgi:AraC-like DNA-binding protein
MPKIASTTLASGPGWAVRDVVCAEGPDDRPFEERHDTVCIAAVTEGTFVYASEQGRATLAPGALLLGNQGACFTCGHAHGTGDRCLSFQFERPFFESVLSSLKGVRHTAFTLPRLPPLERLLPAIARAEQARRDPEALEEFAVALAGDVAVTVADGDGTHLSIAARDERRIAESLRLIERAPEVPLSLSALAGKARMSPYHFLRVFRAVVGATPHQFVLGLRLRRAAAKLRNSPATVSAIAYESGFNDLSEFNRRFRRVMGMTPSAFRRDGGNFR